MSKEQSSFDPKRSQQHRGRERGLSEKTIKKLRSKSSAVRVKKVVNLTKWQNKMTKQSKAKNKTKSTTDKILNKVSSFNDLNFSFGRKTKVSRSKKKKKKSKRISQKEKKKSKRKIKKQNKNKNKKKKTKKIRNKEKKKKKKGTREKERNKNNKTKKKNNNKNQKQLEEMEKNKKKNSKKRKKQTNQTPKETKTKRQKKTNKAQKESLKLLKKLLRLKKEQHKYETKYKKFDQGEMNNLMETRNKEIKEQTVLGNELRTLLKKFQKEKEELNSTLNNLINRQLKYDPVDINKQKTIFAKKQKKIEKLEKEIQRIKKMALKEKKHGVGKDSKLQLQTLLKKLKKITKDSNQYRNDLTLKTSEFLELQHQLEQRKLENSHHKDSNELILIQQKIHNKKVSFEKKKQQVRKIENEKRDLLNRIQLKNNEEISSNFNKLKVELNKKSEINNQLRSLKNQLFSTLNERTEGFTEDKTRESEDTESEFTQSEFEETKLMLNSKSSDLTYSKNRIKKENDNFTDSGSGQSFLIKDQTSEMISEAIEPINKKLKNGQNKIERNQKNELSEESDSTSSGESMPKDQYQIESLDSLFSIPIAIDYFREFLFEQLNQENLLFYLEVTNFKQTCSIDKKPLKKIAKIIYEKFIKNQSIFEINIDFKCRALISEKIKNKEYSIDMFDDARTIVYNHMNLDSFEEFKKSKLYQDFINQSKKQKGESYEFKAHKTAMLIPRGNGIQALNLSFKFKSKVPHGNVVSNNLVKSLTEILNSHYSISNKEIDFQLLSKAISFHRFVDKTTKLQKVKLRSLNEKERTAFFLNVYNCLIFHSSIVNGIPNEDSNSRKKFFQNSRYSVGGMVFSLDDIRYGILRENIQFKNKKKIPYFDKNDNRNQFSVRFDKRTLFALNDFDLSYFHLTPFNSQYLNRQLSDITRLTFNRHIKINKKNKKVYLPRAFKTYAKSFGKNDSLFLKWIIGNTLQNQNPSGFSMKFTFNPLYQNIIMDTKFSLRRYYKKNVIGTNSSNSSLSSSTVTQSLDSINIGKYNSKEHTITDFSQNETTCDNLTQGNDTGESLDYDVDFEDEMINLKSKKYLKVKNISFLKSTFSRSENDIILFGNSKK
ncbi:electron carrier/ protein disulfide oxidoreductase [Anaeramoeba flamelloides]|uniref:Electron carrier/ protein disulfide oxidoreductase n=1 Tax=Anaeramoeba flamelloides TaxID=1746091 RepID=A0ABQ8Z9J7_9EUKA|nr:electron carrier/ protein disulfide oxidoreductase [Anaeramoeba flamelloides]